MHGGASRTGPQGHALDGFLDAMPVGLMVLETDGSIRSANREAWRLLCIPRPHIAVELLMAGPVRAKVREFLGSALAGDAERVSELGPVLRAADGHMELMLLARRHRVGHPDEGLLVGVVEVTGLSVRALDSASRDPLTGLANRRELSDHLAHTIRSGPRGCLLFLDIDGMKRINDSFGHQAGDEVLRTVADRLVEAAPHGALVARVGGDEFVVVSATTSRPESQRLAGQLRAVVREPVVVAEHHLRVTASVGVIGLAGHSTESALAAANEAMYRDKRGLPHPRVSESEEQAAAHRFAREFEVDQLRRDVSRFRDEARTDHLTGCPNRRALFEELVELDERRRRRREPIAIAFVDVDGFREVNKSSGDEHGDWVLAQVAGVLRGACRPGDVVYRKGGEEFVVTLPGVDGEAGARVAERLRSAVEHARIPRGADPAEGWLTVSIGVAGRAEDEPGSMFDALIQAGHRMGVAKIAGRNRVVWRDPQAPSRA